MSRGSGQQVKALEDFKPSGYRMLCQKSACKGVTAARLDCDLRIDSKAKLVMAIATLKHIHFHTNYHTKSHTKRRQLIHIAVSRC